MVRRVACRAVSLAAELPARRALRTAPSAPSPIFGRLFCPAKRKLKNRSTEHKIARFSVPLPSSEYPSAARAVSGLARPPRAARALNQPVCFFLRSAGLRNALAPARARDAAASTAQHLLPLWAPPPAENARARVPTPVRAPTPPVRRAAARAAPARHRQRTAPHAAACARCAGRRRRRQHTARTHAHRATVSPSSPRAGR